MGRRAWAHRGSGYAARRDVKICDWHWLHQPISSNSFGMQRASLHLYDQWRRSERSQDRSGRLNLSRPVTVDVPQAVGIEDTVTRDKQSEDFLGLEIVFI